LNKFFRLLLILPILLSISFSCFKDPVSDTHDAAQPQTGGITGRLLMPSKLPAVHAGIKLYPTNFVPWPSIKATLTKKMDKSDASFTFYTDSEGVYTIPLPDSGAYNLVGTIDEMMVYVSGIDVLGAKSIMVPADTVRLPGSIDGITNLRNENDTDQVRVTLYIPGTQWITKPHIGGYFTFNSLPQGSYQLVIIPDLDNYKVKVLEIKVASASPNHLDTIRLDIKEDEDLVYLDTSRTFSVLPDKQWHSTGQSISMGNSFVVKASGKVISEEYGAFGPDGSTALGGLSFFLVNESVLALFARIGGGTPFKVGLSYMGIAQQTGELQFAINTQKYIVKVLQPDPDFLKVKPDEPLIDTSTAAVATGSFIIDSLVIRKK
jgi:hypothetical protein